jgi:hypothetical protein
VAVAVDQEPLPQHLEVQVVVERVEQVLPMEAMGLKILVAVAAVAVLLVVMLLALVALALSSLKFRIPLQLLSLLVLPAPCPQLLQDIRFILLLQRLLLLKP